MIYSISKLLLRYQTEKLLKIEFLDPKIICPNFKFDPEIRENHSQMNLVVNESVAKRKACLCQKRHGANSFFFHKSPVTEQYCSVTQEEDRSKELVLFGVTEDR